MSVPTIPADVESTRVSAEAGTVARIVAVGALGAVGGLGVTALVYGSLVLGIFGALGGAVVGLIAAARSLEGHQEATLVE